MACQAAATQGDNKLRKGTWLEEEDEQLVTFVTLFGDRKWDFIATASGLKRTGKSCRLRWLNYLRPNLKRGQISAEEEKNYYPAYELWGNKWAKIARRLLEELIMISRTTGESSEKETTSSRRLYDWMPELSGDQTEMKIHGDSGGLDSCFCYLKWNSEDGDTSILDSLGSLWDMN
ncbi:hypothetical protein GH714_028787 [Hevea brasiliensis]|uniref:Uncharacterized protein n=1 Tax=Hevea brasiliensis TaxID=3981 RepID=A0A6A6M4B4_HEVBR|nr:hypothetical protein GH714_028787 [Hevea brasiliensis]